MKLGQGMQVPDLVLRRGGVLVLGVEQLPLLLPPPARHHLGHRRGKVGRQRRTPGLGVGEEPARLARTSASAPRTPAG